MSNMVVRTNVFALNAHRNMGNVGREQRQASNRLSSGYRINSAADDAAGLGISETMRAQIRGLDQASRNAQDAQSMILTTEGGLEEIGNMLQRVRELLVQASNDTNTQQQRTMIEQEIAQLGQEIEGMQNRVEFNTNQVLNVGRHAEVRIDIFEARSLFAEDQAEVALAGMEFAEASQEAREAFGAESERATRVFVTEVQAARTLLNSELRVAITDYDRTAAQAVFDAEVQVATSRRNEEMMTAHENLETELRIATEALTAERLHFDRESQLFIASIRGQLFTISDDLDIASQYGEQGIGLAWFQVGANSGQGTTFDFATVSQAVLVSGQLVQGIAEALVTNGSIRETGIGFGQNVTSMIDSVRDAIDTLNGVRANLGALQNRMDYTMRSLDISSENLSDAESRIRDTDIAREMMNFTMANVLQQAAVSMLAQANQLPNNLLQLLR